MKGWIVTRTIGDGSKRYDASYRVGPRTIKTKTFTKRKDADHFLTATVKTVHDGAWVDVQPTTMNTVFDQWLALAVDARVNTGDLKSSTANAYRSVLRSHLRPAFGGMQSDRLRLAQIEAWQASIAGTMSRKSYANVRYVLSTILKWARRPERRYLTHDPLDGLDAPGRLSRAATRPVFEPSEIAALLAAAPPPDDMILKLAALSGLRRGELFALKWSDIDGGAGQDGGQIHVRRGIYEGVISSPKTRTSERVVDVPQRVLDDLLLYRAMYPPIGDDPYVFRKRDGTPRSPDEWHHERLVPLLTRLGLKRRGSGLHSLRHGYVSLLAAQGVDVNYIAEQVGHSSVTLTRDIYLHVFKRARGEAMRRLNAWDEGLAPKSG
jgi:integrase